MSHKHFQHTTSELLTIMDFLRFGISQANQHQIYYGHGTDNAMDEMWWLISASLGLPFDCPDAYLNARLTQEEKEKLAIQLSRRIIQRIPVPYLIKQAHFCDLPFYIDERVLIPRSPIAELIHGQFAPWVAPEQVSRILDLCTGSGCIAIACCYAFPDSKVDAVDLSQEALDVAAINQKNHQLDDRLQLMRSDCWEQVPAQRYDIIVSNPPYVGDGEMASLPQEYKHEPDMALRAEQNGLALVEKIIDRAHDYLNDQGILVVEVGNSQEALSEAYPHLPFTWLEFEHGGQGVFLLTRQQLLTHKAQQEQLHYER